MVFVKLVKNNAYYKRFQVKFKRRREGKTDYQARKALTFQHKNKYNTPKYRFVVRFTNTKVICQVIFATLTGDKVFCQAQSTELPRYGLSVGLTNYSSAYATGLLLARRLLTNIGLDSVYKGTKSSGDDFDVYKDMEERQLNGEEIQRRPFKCYLDLGLSTSSTGNKVFGALKGAVDGGLHVPHSTKRFPGSTNDDDTWKYNAAVHRKRIFGVHVQEYMEVLKKNDPEGYKRQFSRWDAFLKGRKIEEVYQQVFDAIRKNPKFEKKERAHPPKHVREGNNIKTSTSVYPRPQKLNNQQRKQRVMDKIRASMQRMAS